jgi:DNA (cytosine-5)-methyltransferase 1
MDDDRPTFGSLFAGIGGIDLGLERAGWRGRWQVEWDPFCQRVLAKHWPDIPRYGDIATVDWSGVERVDLLAGGFPCQPVSGAGKRKAQSDERWLWPEFLRAIRALRPSLILVENVTNLLAINGGSAFGEVVGDLAASGYDAEWDCIPAAAVGAPHDRDRIWIVAYPNSEPVRNRAGDMGGPQSPGAREEPEWKWLRPDAFDGRPAVADADGTRLPIGFGRGLQAGSWLGGRTERPGDDPLADAERVDGQGIERRSDDPDQWQEPPQRPFGLRGGTGRHGIGPTQSRMDRAVDGLPAGLDGHRWPAPPGPQYDWEPPRVVVGRLPNRSPRVKSLGNAVVPQVVEMIGRQLLLSTRNG